MLAELGEIGMDLARAVRQQAVAQAIPEQVGALDRMSGGDLALVFSRIARAVRQTLALEAKIYENRRAHEQGEAAEQAQRAATIQRARKERQKNKAKRIIEEAIDAEPRDPSDYENLLADLDDALEDLDAEFGERPFGEILTRICRDLGIAPNWTEWAMETWGIEAGGIEAGGIEAGAIEEAGLWPDPSASDPLQPDSPWPDSPWPDSPQDGWSAEPRSPDARSTEPQSAEWEPPGIAASGRDPP
jgi:hypothetical protein